MGVDLTKGLKAIEVKHPEGLSHTELLLTVFILDLVSQEEVLKLFLFRVKTFYQ